MTSNQRSSGGLLVVYSCGHFEMARSRSSAALPAAPAPTPAELRAVMTAFRLPDPGPDDRTSAESRQLRAERVRTAVERILERVTADLRAEIARLQEELVEHSAGL